MIRLIRCLKRRGDISTQEFRRFWQQPEYGTMLGSLADLSGAIRHTSNLTFEVDINKQLTQFHGTLEPYDGVVEIWWTNAQSVLALMDSEEGVSCRDELLAFEDQFVDRTQSRFFFTECD